MIFQRRKGKKIYPRDTQLIYRFIFSMNMVILTVTVGFFHCQQLYNMTNKIIQNQPLDRQLGTFHWLSLFVSLFIQGIVMSLYLKCFPNHWQSLKHRQKLVRMFMENHWYEVTQVQNTHFFKDFNPRSKERITYFPKVFYRQSNGLIHILVEISLGKYQEPLLNLEKKLESGLYCELTEKELKDSYVEYTLLYDMIANRISSEEMHSEKGSLKLMKNLNWSYDTLPHLLIAGGTGSGKTYFILTLIEALVKAQATVFVLDPKNADLADLQTVMPNVSSSKEDISQCVEDFYSQMMQRSKDMKQMPNYKTGENYAYLDLAPNFLIFDEYVAFMEMLTTKESANILNKLKQIVMLGRQAGFFLILACQRPDAKYLGDGIRDQFNLRVALGRMSDLGYSMMFGETNKQFFLKKIKGRGYIDTGTNVISEFYTPIVSKGHDFLAEIQTIIEKNNYQ